MTHHEHQPTPGEYDAHRNLYMTPNDDHQPAGGDDPWAGVECHTITLPYTKPPLSLNDRGQTPGARAARSAVAALIKRDTATLVRAADIGPQKAIHVRLHYRPKDRRRRDADNLVATLKPCLDGLVAAGVIPDDNPAHLDWSAPRIHEPATDRKPLLWLTVTVGLEPKGDL
jgi:crossover junction endodeoxyribonuclease RusA